MIPVALIQIRCDLKPKLERIEFEVKLKLFALCILKQMEKIRDLMTERSFKEHREEGFPFLRFKRFQQAYVQEYT